MKRCVILSFILFGQWVLFAQDNTPNRIYSTVRYQNGKIASEGFLSHGVPDGYWKTYYVTGILKSEGNRKKMLLDSIWIFYNEIGDTTDIIHYASGKKNGFHLKFQFITIRNSPVRKVLIFRELYLNDKKEGDGYYYYPDGSLHEIIHFQNNRRNGRGEEFDNQGNVITIYDFMNDYMIDKQFINRSKNGLKQGLWRSFYDNGHMKSERNYQDDNLNGYAKDYDIHGNVLLSLRYEGGKLVDQGTSDSLTVDERISYFDNGSVREKGNFVNNRPIGVHRLYNREGKVEKACVYDETGRIASEGIVEEDGSKEGSWKNFYEDGALRSSGFYKNDRQNGAWNFFYAGGSSEETGSFLNGYFSGEWTWYYHDGKILRIENYTQGKREGKFVEFFETGDTVMAGFFKSGDKTGKWISHSGDIMEIGLYDQGLKNGLWKGYYSTGKLYYQGNYSNGYADGKFTYYYETGKIREEQEYINGIKEKTWRKYFPDGLILIAVTYQHDIEIKINGINIERRR